MLLAANISKVQLLTECIENAWNMHGICTEYAWNMHGICTLWLVSSKFKLPLLLTQTPTVSLINAHGQQTGFRKNSSTSNLIRRYTSHLSLKHSVKLCIYGPFNCLAPFRYNVSHFLLQALNTILTLYLGTNTQG